VGVKSSDKAEKGIIQNTIHPSLTNPILINAKEPINKEAVVINRPPNRDILRNLIRKP
jgi:hypothetical protein